MNRRTVAVLALIAFAGGYFAHSVSSRFQPGTDQPTSIAEHWKVVNDFRSYMKDPENYELEPSLGLYGATSPFDHEPSLSALVAAGELEHVDLVFPLVPNSREVNRHWMRFVDSRDDIIQCYGNPSYVSFKTSGEEPLHLRLWFKPSAAGDIQQLIRDLEEQFGRARFSEKIAPHGRNAEPSSP